MLSSRPILQTLKALEGAGRLLHYRCYEFVEDYDLATTVWTHNVTGSTAPTAVDNNPRGTATFTNGGSDNNRIESSHTAEPVQLNRKGAEYWFVIGCRCFAANNNVVEADYGFGLVIQDSDWIGDGALASDGVWLQKDDGLSNWYVVSARGATSLAQYQKSDLPATVDQNWTEWAIRIRTDAVFDQRGQITVFRNGQAVQTFEVSNIPDNEPLAPSFGVQNGEANAKSLAIDYIAWAEVL